MYCPYVHSSTTQPGLVSNIDGVIHGCSQRLTKESRAESAHLQYQPGVSSASRSV